MESLTLSSGRVRVCVSVHGARVDPYTLLSFTFHSLFASCNEVQLKARFFCRPPVAQLHVPYSKRYLAVRLHILYCELFLNLLCDNQ